MNATAEIFDDLSTLADATRSRMLILLERHELTVSELCTILQLPQSTVSRHLKTLSDSGWVASRRDGTSRYYSLSLDDRANHVRRLWSLLREQVSITAGADHDGNRNRRSSLKAPPANGTSCAPICLGRGHTCWCCPD